MMTKQALRRWWFQLHKWIGLLLAVLIIPISLTGAALVWDAALDRWLNPDRYAVTGTAMIGVDTYVAAARGVLNRRDRIVSLTLPDGQGPVIVTATSDRGSTRAGPPARTTVYLDPPTARVVATSDGGGMLRVLHMLHGSLMVPGVGRQIVGWIGVAMLISCVSGLWLWWPSVGRWTRGLRWRRQPGVEANLHHLFGFWIALPLAIVSLTGAWISFPQVFGVFDGGARGGRPPRAQPVLAPALTPGTAIDRARAAAAGAPRQLTWPTDRSPDWTLTLSDGARIAVPDGAAPARLRKLEPETVARLMRRIHDGTGLGLGWQSLLVATGLIPAMLAITGVIMWWRARHWRARRSAGKAATAR